MPHRATRRTLHSIAVAGSNWWEMAGHTCVAAYQPIGAASLAASYVNLANPGTYDATPGVAPDFAAATGWTFNGSSQYLDSSIIPENNQTWSVLARFSDCANTNGAVAGSRTSPTNKYILLQPNRSDSKAGYFSGGSLLVAPAFTSGNIGVVGNQGYRNGSVETGTITIVEGTISYSLFIGAENGSGGGAELYYAGKIQAIVVYSTTLTADDVATLTTRMAALS